VLATSNAFLLLKQLQSTFSSRNIFSNSYQLDTLLLFDNVTRVTSDDQYLYASSLSAAAALLTLIFFLF
jgi:hypothetical protein